MKTHQRNLPVPLEHGIVPWLLAAASLTAGPHVEHLPPWLSLLVATLLLWRLGLWHLRARLPSRYLLALFVAGGLGGIGWQYHTLLGKDAGVALLTLLTALKPMEMHARRDALVIILLGIFLLLTHYFYSQGIATGAWLLLATGALTATLIRLHGGAQPLPAIARYAAVLLAQSIPFMLIFFLLFPRIAGPLWGLPHDAYSALSGLSDTMAPGSLNKLIQSGAIAFRAEFVGTPPGKSELYWRGPVFDEYDGLNWRARELPAQTRRDKPQIATSGKHYEYVSTIEAHNQKWLLALDLPTALPADSELAATFEVLSREALRSRARFAFSSSTDFRANIAESPAVLGQALQLPTGLNPRGRSLAAQWHARQPEEIIASALAMFGQERFYYTLEPPLLGRHAMDEFLFDTRRGFCEHYASAFVFLMRAAGVPARVVTGYQGGELNPVDGYLTVRQSDAHAWAEVWLAGQGWRRVDPTAAVAPSRVEQGIAAALPAGESLPFFSRMNSAWMRTLRNRWEAAGNSWNQWVLGYNPQRQREVLSQLGLTTPSWPLMTAALAGLAGLALLAVSAWVLYQRNTSDPAQQAWLRYCAALRRRGIARADWEGPLDFADRVAQQCPQLSALTRDAARYYGDLRYAGLGDGPTSRQRLHLLRECTRSLPPLWRKKI